MSVRCWIKSSCGGRTPGSFLSSKIQSSQPRTQYRVQCLPGLEPASGLAVVRNGVLVLGAVFQQVADLRLAPGIVLFRDGHEGADLSSSSLALVEVSKPATPEASASAVLCGAQFLEDPVGAVAAWRSTGYPPARQGSYSVTVLRLGNAYRMVTADLLKPLGPERPLRARELATEKAEMDSASSSTTASPKSDA